MNGQIDGQFLADIARLLRRHGPEPFESLAAALRDAEKREEIVEILSSLAAAAREVRRVPGSARRSTRSIRPKVDSLVRSLRREDPAKAQIVEGLYEALAARTALPAKRDIEHFCSKLGMPIAPKDTRAELVLELLHNISKLPVEQAKQVAQAATAQEEPSAEFRGWADIIMKRTNT